MADKRIISASSSTAIVTDNASITALVTDPPGEEHEATRDLHVEPVLAEEVDAEPGIEYPQGTKLIVIVVAVTLSIVLVGFVCTSIGK